MELIPLKTSDIQKIRNELLQAQNYICPITKKILTDKDSVLDHKHKSSMSQEIGEDNAGLCRGVLHYQVNAWEGKVTNSFRRCGLHKFDLSLPEMLRNLADYLESEPTKFVHPTEIPKEPKIGKREFNKILKLFKEKYPKRKLIEFPKSGKWTKQLISLKEEFASQLN